MKNKKLPPQLSGALLLSLLLVFLLQPTSVRSEPFHSPVIDGTISGDGTDWAPADLVVDDSHDEDTVKPINVRRLWCTWDAENLYIGVTYQDFSDTAALVVYLDLDRGIGPNDASVLDSFAGQFLMPEDHRFELILGRSRGDGNNLAVIPIPRLATDNDSTTVDLSGDVTIAQGQSFEFPGPDKSRLPFWFNTEFAIPWSSIYPDVQGIVPANAVIKAVALTSLGLRNKNGIDSAPDNDGLDQGTTPVTFYNMHSSVIDANGDGIPDPSDASISGLVNLPDNDGQRVLRISADLENFSGRDPVAALSSFTGDPGETAFSLPRLPAGDYELTFRCSGYLSTTANVTVTESQQLSDFEITLAKSASISGEISFSEGDGGAGTVTLSHPDESFIDSIDFTSTGGSYIFYLEEGGNYLLSVAAENYMDDETSITLQDAEDLTGINFEMIQQTKISGSVDFESGPGSAGTVSFLNAEGDTLDSDSFPFNGDTFEFFTPVGGIFTVQCKSPTYVLTDSTFTVTAFTDVPGIDLVMPRAAQITTTFEFEGPEVEGLLVVTNDDTGQVMDFGTTFHNNGDPYAIYLDPGNYVFLVTAPGYVPEERLIAVGLENIDLGPWELLAVTATHLVIVDEDDEVIPEVRAIYYDPAEDPWTADLVRLSARDDAGLTDLYDLEGRLSNFRLSALKMDDTSPPTGTPVFYRSESESDTSSTLSFNNGIAEFWMSDTAVEVLRVYLRQPGRAPIAGRIVVAFEDPRPTYVVLTAKRGNEEADTLVADDVDFLEITATLYDSAFEESLASDIPVAFSVSNTSSGVGNFEVATDLTDAGVATANLTATGSGVLNVTCSVVINNRVLVVTGLTLDSGEEFLSLNAIAGPTTGWHLGLLTVIGDVNSPVDVTAQLVDQFGNPTKDDGIVVSFSADPASLGSFSPASAATDTNGRAVAQFVPLGNAGMVTIRGTGNGYTPDEVNLSLHNLQVISDPVWYNEPLGRRTFEPTDLTALVVDNTPDRLILDIPFNSNWEGMQLHVLFETNFDAEGATTDPFGMPVNYGHENKPDYVLTTKYSANDYGDFRRFNTVSNSYEFWIIEYDDQGNPTQDGLYTGGGDGQSIQAAWTTKTSEGMTIQIPWTPFGASAPHSMRLQVYLTQEASDGTKRSAFDSAPHDSTMNLVFDWENPEDDDWDFTENPITLHHYGETYIVKTDFPDPPAISTVIAEPSELVAGEIFRLSAAISHEGDGIGDVLADMQPLGGSSLTRMFDDGDSAHGDAAADDGIYSLRMVVPWGNPGGEKIITVKAFDASNASFSTDGSATVQVTANIDPILVFPDATGDDHGPNQADSANKYYTYPTNIAFVPGAFDLTGLTVYETKVNIGGEDIDMIAFQVGLVDFPDPNDPGTASWSPLYANLNIEKIDILIDSAPGGATATLPQRQAGVQRWDAWDYAIVMDGWYKALIPSLGQNTLDSWRDNALSSNRDITIIGDPDQDVVTAFVSKAALGNPTVEDILRWDMVVSVAGHDFGGEEVLGGCRWVNESRSEWQFGGGKNEDKDSNLMDLILIPGSDHSPGLTQEEILDYESPDALDRLDRGETPVAIEMSQFEDTGPPVIDTGGGNSILTQILPLEKAPLAMTVNIVDDYQVDRAIFRYRSTGFAGDGWDRQVSMGYLGKNRWVVDILPSWLDSNLVYSPVDSTRYLEFEVQAFDHLDQESTSPVTTLQIWPDRFCRLEKSTLETENLSLRQVEGAALLVPDRTRNLFIQKHLEEAWTGPEASADTMGEAVQLEWDICEIPEGIKSAKAVPEGRPIGVFRDIYIATTDTLGGFLDYPGVLPDQVQLSLHYPQDWLSKGIDENKIALYRYNMSSNRWVLTGGNVTPTGNNVTATIERSGTFGLFYTEGLEYDASEVISGISISPSPFSPNGDDLYDETTISFFLSREATVTVEVFNIQGVRKIVLEETFPYSGTDLDDPTPRRVPGLIWDGRENNGDLVPYGIYILRITATYNQAGGTRSIRSNHSLAVIR